MNNKNEDYDEEKRWDERFKKGRHRREDPSRFLIKWADKINEGKALDIACGAGRNAIYLAQNGFEVTGLDISSEALKIAEKRAKEKNLEIDWIHEKQENYDIKPSTYDLITISYFHIHENKEINRIINGLKKQGYLLWENHIKTDADVDIGPDSEFRYERGELLEILEDLVIIEYIERIEDTLQGRRAISKIIGQKKQ